MITTLKGEKAVETLVPGERIVTRDNGLQTVRRVFRRDFDYSEIAAAPHLAPLLLTQGSLGKHLPERDTLVSPNLRMLVPGGSYSFDTLTSEALLGAKSLVDGDKVRSCAVLGVSYIYLGFDRHEVVLANGVWMEAFCASDMSSSGRATAQRLDLAEVMGAGVLAREMALKGAEA